MHWNELVLCSVHSSNILLDEHMQPKLSDFGLAHLRPHSVDQSCTIVMDTSSHSNLGYLPEEYIRDGKLSVKLDVYSLGMVSSASYFKNDIPESVTICINKDLHQNFYVKILVLWFSSSCRILAINIPFSLITYVLWQPQHNSALFFLNVFMLAGNIRDMYRTEGETGDGKEPVFGKNPLREQKIKYFYLPKQSRHNDNTHTHTHCSKV